jgi:hypothetical protein
MQGSLGEKIGEGVFADVHAWAPGQVVKLLKAGATRWESRREARMTRAIFAAGAPAPEVFGEVELILAALCRSVHKTPPPPDIPFLRDVMYGWLRISGAAVPEHIATGILDLIERLRPGDGLCHADPNPGNVIMTVDGPRFVDWGAAVRAPAVLDLASCHIGLTELAPEVADNPQRPLAVNAAAQTEYARLAGMSEAALTAAVKPYLPIIRVRIVLAEAVPGLRERLIQRIEADLRPED